jgi:hypothetical protein
LTATARAVIYTSSSISSFNSSAGINGDLLPATLDVNAWTNFYATGQSPDGTVHTGGNGQPQLQIYPSPGNAPGNFGLLSAGPPSSSQPTFANWIVYGPSSSDLAYLQANNMPVSATSPMPWTGGPGLKSSLDSNFESIEGQGRLMPIFQPVTTSPYQAANGTGSSATYNIIGFVGVTISHVNGDGSNMSIYVQPAAVVDPTAIYTSGSLTPAGEGSSTTTTFAVPKLVQ